MVKQLRSCCVPQCSDKSSPRFSIPTAERIRTIWIERINNEKLPDPKDYKFVQNYRVCKSHFDNLCIEHQSGRLMKFSLPTLNLPDYNEPSTEETCFSRPEAPYQYKTPEILKEIFKKLPVVDTTACRSTYEEDDSPLHVKQPEKVYRGPTKAIFTPPLHSDKPGSSTADVPDVPTTEISYEPSASKVVPEPELHIQDVPQSTHKTQPSKAIAIPLRRKISTARKKTSNNKSRLLKAEVCFQSLEISKIQNQPKVLKTPNSNNFCRLCFKEGKPKDLQTLEGEYIPIAPVVDFLGVVLGYKFPESTCENCFQEITQISLFIEKCLDAQQIFKQIREDHEYVAADEKKNRTKKQKNYEKVNTKKINNSKVCDKCGGTITSLTKHYRISKECQPKNALCAECGKTFANFSALDVHMGSHIKGDSLPFMCHICSKMFRYNDSLRKHLQVHNFGNQFVCEKCGKRFPGSSGLQKHLKQVHHTGKRPYNCPECSKAFTEHSRLKYHMGVHTGEKTFVCDLCNKSFYWKKNFIVHRRIHTGERPYECHVCGESYRESQKRRRHIIRSHGLEQTQFINIANISES